MIQRNRMYTEVKMVDVMGPSIEFPIEKLYWIDRFEFSLCFIEDMSVSRV